ncbi:unnamed protein product [Prorocentrum cordatum]|uniref:Uncharacterized protein n=1 Tax=Prorocentrum cordatum TaxID=2364126 RepID=A0ABN9TER2_9DINO|nr:unnamed protein product [Polarella glacialis]
MPCMEHSSIPAGFAFVNFASPQDVHTLCGAVVRGLWREVCRKSPKSPPSVSYARFQGHVDLVQHFSVSAVLQEQDPERRPIFRPEVLLSSASVAGPSTARKVLSTCGPPGLADDAEVSNLADPAVKEQAPGVPASKHMQESSAVALLREKSRDTMQAESEEETYSKENERLAFEDKYTAKEVSMPDDSDSIYINGTMISL